MAATWLLAELESNAGLWTPDSVLLHNGQISLSLSLSLSKTGSKQENIWVQESCFVLIQMIWPHRQRLS